MQESVSFRGRRTPYVETFDDGPGGWAAWGLGGDTLPEVRNGILFTRSPWRVDANHAPPGAGYLHLLAFLRTRADVLRVPGPNRFVDGEYSRDLTNARITVRLRGEVDLRGTRLLLLAQADVPGTRTNFVLTGQPFQVTPEWSESTVTLTPDPAHWVCLGARHDRTQVYGQGRIDQVLRDLNVDIDFVLFPLRVVPTQPVDDVDLRLPHRDYEADRRYLPEGEIQFDTVRIDYGA